MAFHYYQAKVLLTGYEAFFRDAKPTPYNEFAFASIGRSLEATRFYFADAAASFTYANEDGGDERFKLADEARKLSTVNRYLIAT